MLLDPLGRLLTLDGHIRLGDEIGIARLEHVLCVLDFLVALIGSGFIQYQICDDLLQILSLLQIFAGGLSVPNLRATR